MSNLCNNILECNREYINPEALYEVLAENDVEIQKMYKETDFNSEYFMLKTDLEKKYTIKYYESGSLHIIGVDNANYNFTVTLPTSTTCKAIMEVGMLEEELIVFRTVLDTSKVPYRFSGNRFYVLDSRYNNLFWQAVRLAVR